MYALPAPQRRERTNRKHQLESQIAFDDRDAQVATGRGPVGELLTKLHAAARVGKATWPRVQFADASLVEAHRRNGELFCWHHARSLKG